ncbi:DUF6545 domain-containing protein [Streptomyces sp. NPDC090119]|uniref:DUF6545 domain-containing protein n=1 Tax=Streptomyces sp. NPDC090119 TaxID=3365951 RepID=UPI003815E647
MRTTPRRTYTLVADHRPLCVQRDGARPGRSPHHRARASWRAPDELSRDRAWQAPRKGTIMEAAVLRAAVRAKKEGNEPMSDVAPPTVDASPRAGDLRAETEWLLLVAHAYAHGESADTASGATGVRA